MGRVILESTDIRVHPVFVTGISDDLKAELGYNWNDPQSHPIDCIFGPAIEFDDLRAKGSRAATQLKASDRCLQAISKLCDEHRRIVASRRKAG